MALTETVQKEKASSEKHRKSIPDYVVKTIRVKLKIAPEDEEKILETFKQFNQACNNVIEAG